MHIFADVKRIDDGPAEFELHGTDGAGVHEHPPLPVQLRRHRARLVAKLVRQVTFCRTANGDVCFVVPKKSSRKRTKFGNTLFCSVSTSSWWSSS